MSEENVEIVRDAWRAFIERGLDGSAGYYAEDCVIEALPEAPDRATRHGREGIRLRYEEWAEAWAELTWEPLEFIDAGEDVVVAVVAMRGRSQVGGAPVDIPVSFVYELRDSLVVRDRPFGSKDQALESAGLSE